jgi:hypothetical protein
MHLAVGVVQPGGQKAPSPWPRQLYVVEGHGHTRTETLRRKFCQFDGPLVTWGVVAVEAPSGEMFFAVEEAEQISCQAAGNVVATPASQKKVDLAGFAGRCTRDALL